MSQNGQHHTLVALVEDRPGVLTRVASMFRRRGFNIASLAVGKSEQPGLSRMTFVVSGDEDTVSQVTKQLDKLIEVIRGIRHYQRGDCGQGVGAGQSQGYPCLPG